MTSTARPAAAITLSYLIATLPLALRVLTVGGASVANAVGASESRAWLVVATHIAAVIVLAWATFGRARPIADATRITRAGDALLDWLPLILVSFLYAELPWLMASYRAGGAQPVIYHDALVQRMELAVFGTQPSHTLAGALPTKWISEPLHFGYISYYLIIYLPPLLLYVRGRREAFARETAALMLAFTSCFLVFALFPVEGPRYAWSAPPSIPDGLVRQMTLWVLHEGSSRGAAFPSSHAAVSVAQTVALWRVRERSMSSVVGAMTFLLIVGAVYGGFHYAVDMAVGALVGVGAAVLGTRARVVSGAQEHTT